MIRRWWWLAAGVAGAAMTVLIMGVLPPDRTIDNPLEFLLRLSPVLLAVLAIGGFPQRAAPGLILLAAVVVGYMGVLDTLYVLRVVALADGGEFAPFYQMAIFVNAFTILAILFGYRLGGAPTARVLRLGFAAALVLVSGLNDLTFYYLNDWPEGRPARLDWASHITVFVGGTPTPAVAIVFCAVHLLLATVVLFLPASTLLRRRETPQPSPLPDAHRS